MPWSMQIWVAITPREARHMKKRGRTTLDKERSWSELREEKRALPKSGTAAKSGFFGVR